MFDPLMRALAVDAQPSRPPRRPARNAARPNDTPPGQPSRGATACADACPCAGTRPSSFTVVQPT